MQLKVHSLQRCLSTAIRNYDDVLQPEPDGKLVQAASPPDVRKVSDFPHGAFCFGGAVPRPLGRSPRTSEQEERKGSAFPHIERHSRWLAQ